MKECCNDALAIAYLRRLNSKVQDAIRRYSFFRPYARRGQKIADLELSLTEIGSVVVEQNNYIVRMLEERSYAVHKAE